MADEFFQRRFICENGHHIASTDSLVACPARSQMFSTAGVLDASDECGADIEYELIEPGEKDRADRIEAAACAVMAWWDDSDDDDQVVVMDALRRALDGEL